MKKWLSAAAAFTVLGLTALPALSNDTHQAQAEAQKRYAAKGEVVSVDQAGGKIKLKHEAVPELKWPGMTMDFAVADKAVLNGIKAGDRVEFRFALVGGIARIVEIKHLK